MTPQQQAAIADVCYLPEETVSAGARGSVGWWTWKLTVNAGFE